MQRIHTDDDAIESQIQAKGLTAPRITPADVEAAIDSEHYFTAQEGFWGAHPGFDPSPAPHQALALLTFCVLVLRNGFTVTGESACASPENFDAQIGRDVARKNAVNKIWPLLGYQLKNDLHRRAQLEAHIDMMKKSGMQSGDGSGEQTAESAQQTSEGELQVNVGEVDGHVVVDFGKQIVWFGMQPDDAIHLAKTIHDRAVEMKAAQQVLQGETSPSKH